MGRIDDSFEISLATAAVYNFFKDVEKTQYWMTTENANLGDISPVQMIYTGRGDKLLKWIDNTLKENKPLDARGKDD